MNEFEIGMLADDHIDEWIDHPNKKLRRLNLRRWNRVLKMLGDQCFPPQFAKVKPANINAVNRWVTGMADEFRPVLQYLLAKEKDEENIRIALLEGKFPLRGIDVESNIGFFQDYCDSQAEKGTPDTVLEAMIRAYVAATVEVKQLSDADFTDLYTGRKQTPAECLASLFGDAGSWVGTPVDIAEELQESRDNIAQWEEWEREDEEKAEAAKAALAAWRAERGA